MDLKEKVKAVRLDPRVNLDQDEFADEIGYSFSLYSKVEAGHKKVSRGLINSIKDRYGIPDGYFDGDAELIITTPVKVKKSDTSYWERLINELTDARDHARKEAADWKAQMEKWEKQATNLAQGFAMGKANALTYAGTSTEIQGRA